MNILTESLPNKIIVDNIGYNIVTDFRDWIRFEQMILDSSLTNEEKILLMLDWYVDDIPPNYSNAIEGLLNFYRIGKQEKSIESQNEKIETKLKKDNGRVYDYDQDAPFIYASFYQVYKIDLCTINLHWFQFCALLEGLPDDVKFMKIIGYRVAETKGLSKTEKDRVNKMKKLYALTYEEKQTRMTLEDRNIEMKKYIQKRFESLKK